MNTSTTEVIISQCIVHLILGINTFLRDRVFWFQRLLKAIVTLCIFINIALRSKVILINIQHHLIALIYCFLSLKLWFWRNWDLGPWRANSSSKISMMGLFIIQGRQQGPKLWAFLVHNNCFTAKYWFSIPQPIPNRSPRIIPKSLH